MNLFLISMFTGFFGYLAKTLKDSADDINKKLQRSEGQR